MIATFIGHRKIQNSELLTEQIKQTVLNLIDEKQVDTFLFGSRSAFDDLCLETVTEIKKLRPHIKRIYVRAAYPYIDSAYEAYLLKFYDATYIPDKIENAGKAAYVERNEYMIDKADVCIFIITKTINRRLNLQPKTILKHSKKPELSDQGAAEALFSENSGFQSVTFIKGF